MERKTITKWFWVWQYEDEEKWLNEMAAGGWVLESVGFCRYTFVRCEPGSYTVRTEMRPYDEQYVRFMEETGAEYVGRMMMWIYFRKKTEDGVFDLYSDIDSMLKIIYEELGHTNLVEICEKTAVDSAEHCLWFENLTLYLGISSVAVGQTEYLFPFLVC